MVKGIEESEYRQRIARLQELLRQSDIGVGLVSSSSNVYYLSGFMHYVPVRPIHVVVPAEGAPVLVAPKGEYEMGEKLSWIPDVRYYVEFPEAGRREDAFELLGDVVRELGASTGSIGVEQDSVVLNDHRRLGEVFAGRSLSDVSPLMKALRIVKSKGEVALLEAAGQVAIASWEAALAVAKPGVAEYVVAAEALTAGADFAAKNYELPADAFLSPTIEGSQILGAAHRSSMNHVRASTRLLEKGDLVMMCFCLTNVFKGYRVGFCRHFSLGQPNEEHRRMFDVLLRTQEACLEEVRPGTTAARVDDINRARLAEAGLVQHLGHRVGRGVGIDVVEAPLLKNTDETVLAPGMAISVEPAVYIPGEVGLEIEDTVLVTEDGYRSLTPTAKEIFVV